MSELNYEKNEEISEDGVLYEKTKDDEKKVSERIITFERIEVSYKNKLYKNNPMSTMRYSIKNSDLPSELEEFCFRIEEKGNHINFIRKNFFFDMINDLPMFYEEKTVIYSFDKESKSFETYVDKENLESVNLNYKGMNTFYNYLLSCFSYKNYYSYIKFISLGLNNQNVPFLKNMINLVLNAPDAVEKLFKSGNEKILEINMNKNDFEINNEGGLNKVIKIPKFAIDFMSKNNLFELNQELRRMYEIDGNTLKVYIEFLSNMKNFYSLSDKHKLEKSTKEINNLLERKYRITDLLNYIIKQNFYYSPQKISFPFYEINLLNDYSKMVLDFGFKRMDKYPQKLKRDHDIAVKNMNVLNIEDNGEFEKIIKEVEFLNYETDNFIFKLPRNAKDLVEEGSMLNHCVASYYPNILTKNTIIVFCRKKDSPNKPFITVEVSPKDYSLQEVAGENNVVPGETIMTEIKKWNGIIKRKKK